MQELKDLLFEVRDEKIAIITINRPEVRNAMTANTWTEFNLCLDEVEANPAIRVLIITGAGEKSFMAGADIVTLKTREPMYQFRHPYSADAAIRLALKHKRKGLTTFIISHRLTTLAEADFIIVLEDGRVAQQGTHAQLIAQDGLYKRIYQIQTSLEDELMADAI